MYKAKKLRFLDFENEKRVERLQKKSYELKKKAFLYKKRSSVVENVIFDFFRDIKVKKKRSCTKKEF